MAFHNLSAAANISFAEKLAVSAVEKVLGDDHGYHHDFVTNWDCHSHEIAPCDNTTQLNWAPYSVMHNWRTVGQLQRRDSLEELREMLKPPRPPPGYYCHVCFSTEHYINYCPVGLNVDCKTPYKGHKKSIGLFVCPKCKRRWTSNNSYAGMSEKCSNCHCDTFPKKQYPFYILTNPRFAHLRDYVTNFSKYPNSSNVNRYGPTEMAGNQYSSIPFANFHNFGNFIQ